MRKEITLAILIGLVMGLFITFGVYQARKSEERTAATDVQKLEENVEPSPEVDQDGKLAVHHPQDETVQAETNTKVAGQAPANAQIVIFVNQTPYLTQADETGNFSKEVELDTLSNVITVHAVDEDGVTSQVQKTVIVYDQELDPEQLNMDAAEASPAAQVNEENESADENANANEDAVDED